MWGRELTSGQGLDDDVFEHGFPIWEQGFLFLITRVTVQTLRSDSSLADLSFMMAVNSLQRNLVLSHAHLNKEVLFFNHIHKVIQILLS